jgi:hypothetical protein
MFKLSMTDVQQRYFLLFVVACFLLGVIGSSLFFGTSGVKEALENYIFVKPPPTLEPEIYNGLPEPTCQMHMFAENTAKADCCTEKNSYTTSNGCLCVSKDQIDYLNKRGGNAL